MKHLIAGPVPTDACASRTFGPSSGSKLFSWMLRPTALNHQQARRTMEKMSHSTAVAPGLPARRKGRGDNPYKGMNGSESGRPAGCNRKRQQAGRTPNALRSFGTLSMARQRLECAELAPAFAARSRVAPSSNQQTRIETLNLVAAEVTRRIPLNAADLRFVISAATANRPGPQQFRGAPSCSETRGSSS